jgi:hypothetical protein
MATTWSASDKSANIVLSNANLTVTNSTGADGGVRASASFSGKVYFEYTATNLTGGNTGVGIATTAANLTVIGAVGVGGVMTYASGNTYFNGASVGSIGSPGNTVCVAIDIPNGLYWARGCPSGIAGNWNNSGTANPATGAGGFNISGLFPTNAVFACTASNSTSSNITANFGATAFAQAVPAGFSAAGGGGAAGMKQAAVVTVAAGGLPVVEVPIGLGLPVSEATNGFGRAVTKVAKNGLAVTYV